MLAGLGYSNCVRMTLSFFISMCLLRCLMADGMYDVPVVFCLCERWFSESHDADVNAQLSETFRAVPSHKFLCLVYQIASRISAATSGPLIDSGYQVGAIAYCFCSASSQMKCRAGCLDDVTVTITSICDLHRPHLLMFMQCHCHRFHAF